MLLMAQRYRRFQSLAVMLLAITIANGKAPRHPDSDTRSASAAGEKRKLTGVGNFGEVTPKLFRGAQPTRKGFEALARSGIDIVVDTRGNRTNSEGKVVRRLGMRYVAIPWHCPFPHDETFARFLKLVRDNPDKKIFVHCRLGDDRTGMMIASYRMADEGWSADRAMREMQQFGFTRVHHVICPTLASYEKDFPRHLKTNPAFQGVR